MTSGTRWVLAGIAGFILVIIARAPASWFRDQLPSRIQCTSLQGTVWNGYCSGLQIEQGVPNRAPLAIDSLRWDLKPLRLLRGQAAAHVQLQRGDGSASADVHAGAGGSLDVSNLNGSLRVDRELLPPLPRGWHGQTVFRDLAFRLDGSRLTQLSGAAQLRGLVDERGAALGSYELDFGAEPQSAPFNGRLRSLDGPLQVDAAVRLEASTAWQMDGTVLATGSAPSRLARQLEALGPADASGRRRFSISAEP